MGSKTQVGESPHLKGGINEKGGIVRERRNCQGKKAQRQVGKTPVSCCSGLVVSSVW